MKSHLLLPGTTLSRVVCVSVLHSLSALSFLVNKRSLYHMKQVDSNLPLLGNKCSFLLRLHPGFSFSGITHVQLPIASSESPNMAALVTEQTRLCSIWEAACVRLLPASLCLFSFNTAGPNSERSWKSLRGSLGRLDSASSRLCESFLAFVPADRWVIVWHF